MTTSNLSSGGASMPLAQSAVQQVPISDARRDTVDVDGVAALPSSELGCAPTDGWSQEWADRLGSVLWQLGFAPEVIEAQLGVARAAGMSTEQLETAYATLTRELALSHASDAWHVGTEFGQVQGGPWSPEQGPVQVPGQVPGTGPGQQPPATDGPPSRGPDRPPPFVTPPDARPTPPAPPSTPPTVPGPPPTVPGPPPTGGRPTPPKPPGDVPGPPPSTDPPPGGGSGDGPSLAPWLIGAGILGAGIAGALAFRTGARNVHALRATAAAFDSGAMHQGGLQSIRDAGLGARFTAGIGTREYLSVALPGINRVGTGAQLTAAARGHLDHAELLATSAGLRRGVGDAVTVHAPTQQHVLAELVRGRSMGSVLDDLDRSAKGSRPVFDNPQLQRYWDRTSIVERGPRVAGHDVMSGVSVNRPELALEPVFVAGPGGTTAARQIVETGGSTRIDQLVAGRGARLDRGGLADGIGTIQGVNVSTLNPAMRDGAVRASGVDPRLVETIGLNGAFTQRWRDRIAAGMHAQP